MSTFPACADIKIELNCGRGGIDNAFEKIDRLLRNQEQKSEVSRLHARWRRASQSICLTARILQQADKHRQKKDVSRPAQSMEGYNARRGKGQYRNLGNQVPDVLFRSDHCAVDLQNRTVRDHARLLRTSRGKMRLAFVNVLCCSHLI